MDEYTEMQGGAMENAPDLVQIESLKSVTNVRHVA